MRFLVHMGLLLAVTGFIFTIAACGVNKDEHEKIVSEHKKAMADLAKKQDELDKTKTELEKIKIKLDQANHESAEEKGSFTETHNKIKTALEKCSKEKKAMESSFIASRREVEYLRDKMDELINSFRKVSNELNLTVKANEVLRQHMDELTSKRDGMKNLTKN